MFVVFAPRNTNQSFGKERSYFPRWKQSFALGSDVPQLKLETKDTT